MSRTDISDDAVARLQVTAIQIIEQTAYHQVGVPLIGHDHDSGIDGDRKVVDMMALERDLTMRTMEVKALVENLKEMRRIFYA